jgi:cytochrome c oxidase subunit IV
MSTQMQTPPQRQEVSGWAVGGIVFAATMMVLIGVFQALAGLVAIFNDEFYVVTQNYTFDLDVSAWGWIHLLVGLAVLATGFGLFARSAWAGVTAIVLCMLSALVNFFFIPYYPIWSLVVIGLNVWVIWSLTRPGAIET